MTEKDFLKPGPLLEGRPLPTTLSGLFPLPRQMNTKPERLEATRLLLTADTAGSGVDNALFDTVSDITELTRLIDLTLIDVLVWHKASVNYENGKCFQLTIMKGDLDILSRLCNARSSV